MKGTLEIVCRTYNDGDCGRSIVIKNTICDMTSEERVLLIDAICDALDVDAVDLFDAMIRNSDFSVNSYTIRTEADGTIRMVKSNGLSQQ